MLHQCKVGRGHGTKVTNLPVVNFPQCSMVRPCVLEMVVRADYVSWVNVMVYTFKLVICIAKMSNISCSCGDNMVRLSRLDRARATHQVEICEPHYTCCSWLALFTLGASSRISVLRDWWNPWNRVDRCRVLPVVLSYFWTYLFCFIIIHLIPTEVFRSVTSIAGQVYVTCLFTSTFPPRIWDTQYIFGTYLFYSAASSASQNYLSTGRGRGKSMKP